MTMTMLYYIA